MKIKIAYLAVIYALILQGKSLAQNTVWQLDPAVRTGKLANGFTYYIRHNEEPKNRVILFLANKVGSVLEDDDQQGLAHFMEHMSFNGTKHFPKNELVNYLQKSGIRFGADLNAYTSFDETIYQLPLPSDNPELLKNGVQIMRDWAHEATLDPSEIDKERGVVLEEKRLAKGAAERMRRIYYPIILNHSRYANRLPIGIDTVLNNFKPATLRRFYEDWYRPDLQALIVVGDVDVDAMEKMVKEKFSDLKNPPKEKTRVSYKITLDGKNKFVSVTDKEMTATQIEILIKHQAPQLKTVTDYQNNIVRGLFNQMLSARYGELRLQPDPPFIAGGAGIGNFLDGLDVYSVNLTAKTGELERGLKAVWRETVRVKQFGFTEPELDRAKKSLASGINTALKEQSKTSSEVYVKEYLANFLKGVPAPGIAEEYKIIMAYLPLIHLADVNKVSSEYIKSINQDILITAPKKEEYNLPTEPTIKKWMASVEAEKLSPYKDKDSANDLPLLTKEPFAGKIIGENKDSILHTTTLTLSNGAKVILKSTDYKNDQVLFNAFAQGGTSLYSDADFQSADNAANIISAAGAGNYNTIAIGKFLTGKQANVNVGISERFQTVSGSCTTEDLKTAMQLIYARFTEPRKDPLLFENIIARSKASLANRGDDPNSVFQDTIASVLSRDNLRRTGPSVKKLNQINLDRAFEIYKERFADASGFTFIFTGNFTESEIKPLIEKYIASLPFTNSNEKAKDLGIHFPEGIIEKTVYKGTEPKATVNLFFSGAFDYSLSEKLKLDALKEVLEIRLLERLREEESGVYSPAVNDNVAKYPQSRYSFVISFGCAPQNVERLISSVLDEIKKLKLNGPPKTNIDKFRAEEMRSIEIAMKTNNWWLSYLTNVIQNNDDPHNFSQYNKLLEEIDPESLKNIANKYLSGKNYIRMVLAPAK